MPDINKELVEALRKAEQLAQIARDWNLYEVEIDGEMVDIYALTDEFSAALTRAKAAGKACA